MVCWNTNFSKKYFNPQSVQKIPEQLQNCLRPTYNGPSVTPKSNSNIISPSVNPVVNFEYISKVLK
jgi:hypothetical protein